MQQLKHRLLAQRRAERQRLYQILSPLFTRHYGTKKGNLAREHSKTVAEQVGKYTKHAKDQKWAKASVIVAAIHPLPLDMFDDIRKVLSTILPQDQLTRMMDSFLNFNKLRIEDEIDPEKKNKDVYKKLAKPYVSEEGLALLPPETFARTVDMADEWFYFGASAGELHKTTSYGPHEWMNRNLAHSIYDVWRPAAIQLMLFGCYDSMSKITAKILYPQLYGRMLQHYKTNEKELMNLEEKFRLYLDLVIKMISIPLVPQTDRLTKEEFPYRTRIKTVGSATLKAVVEGICDPEGKDFDATRINEEIHDFVAGTFVTKETHQAISLYDFILTHHYPTMIFEFEDMFNGRHSENGRSCPDYKGVAHIDYKAERFGANNVQRVELHVRSYESYLDYYLSSTAGRGVRDSRIIGDAWGDMNFKIVEALGRLEEHIQIRALNPRQETEPQPKRKRVKLKKPLKKKTKR